MKIRRDCKNALVRQHGSCLSATAFLFRKPSGFSIVYHTRGAFADGKRGDTADEMGQSLFGGCVDYTTQVRRLQTANAETQPLIINSRLFRAVSIIPYVNTKSIGRNRTADAFLYVAEEAKKIPQLNWG